MDGKNKRIFSLRSLVIALVTLSMALTLAMSVLAGYQVTNEALFTNSLNVNQAYATKLASSTDLLLKSAQNDLFVTAEQIVGRMDDKLFLQHEISRFFESTNTFNSVIVTDAMGHVLGTSPESLGIVGERLTLPAEQQALREQRPLISEPYLAITGKLIVFISTPIVDQGRYLGFLGGSIYLQEPNILFNILGQHFYKDGSYVYVVDRMGHLIYHPQPERLGDVVTKNKVVQKLLEGKSGAERVINTKGIDMLAGYASIPSSGWGVVSQTPTAIALAPSWELIREMFYKVLPFFIMLLILSWWFANRIANPLRQLSQYASKLSYGEINSPVPQVSIWYMEMKELNRVIVNHLRTRVNDLTSEAQTDPLTGLANRRLMNTYMDFWIDQRTPFSIILIDIDHFKLVNDTYGHQTGDEVLGFLAAMMQKEARKGDICCRYGGEEFVILLPYASSAEAQVVAERLRGTMLVTEGPIGKPVTLSLGIANYPKSAEDIPSLFKCADKALYQAKQRGRNRSVMFDD
jgi:diguanylate cyclase (GGDEF)-like protein